MKCNADCFIAATVIICFIAATVTNDDKFFCSDAVTNGMNDLNLTSSPSHEDEIGFMDDDDLPSSSSASPQKHVPSSSSMTSSDFTSTTDSDVPNAVLESKSEIESSEKSAKKTLVNGACGRQKTKHRVHFEGQGEAEFDSDLDVAGFVEDLRDSDAE